MIRWLIFIILLTFAPASADAMITQQDTNDMPPSVEMERDGDELTLSWGPHPNTGYQISILDSYEGEDGWNVVYSLSYPPEGNQEGILHTETHPQAKTTVPKEVQDIHLYEEKNGQTYEQLPTTTVHDRYTWTLDFDQDLSEDMVSNDLIYLTDKNNEKLENVILISSPSQIKILPPTEDYEPGEVYHLYIDPMLENTDGDSLEQGYKQTFYIDDDGYSNQDWQPPNPIENHTFTFDAEAEDEDERNSMDSERIYSIFPIENEDGNVYVIRHTDPENEEEVAIPPVTAPSSFFPLHPLLPYPHQYAINEMS
ncbi:hypothetical protein HNR44_001531 [Geomicrobium halophilum]|uniref:SbsA Ig-like domain-containing protein n=1 Tax=Geomicrobium halophilum TaxID=549000 RepID=A0A841PYS6_9BACL|nr:hypothetical protein [Geomicrobium halophilum]MBB6449582.1 hypothetical protein [Geomicrobium halophilum]